LKDQRTASAYIFGAICPALGKATGLVLPFCNTEAMELHLQEIALHVQPDAHAVLFVDQAGWHVTEKLNVPENMTLAPLPSKSPELNPVENIWQYMRDLPIDGLKPNRSIIVPRGLGDHGGKYPLRCVTKAGYRPIF
jgi:hypothetical protein